jgi:hypothetical protein
MLMTVNGHQPPVSMAIIELMYIWCKNCNLFGTTTGVRQATLSLTNSFANILTLMEESQWMEAKFPSILKPTLSKLSTRHIDSLIRPVTTTFHIFNDWEVALGPIWANY